MPEATLARSSIYAARPTLRIAGQEDPRVSELLLAMTMEEAEGGMSHLELRFANLAATEGGVELAFGARSTLRLGAELSVYAGDEAAPREIFRGKISALEMVCSFGAPPELVVLAEDALTLARRDRQSRVFADQSPADVVRAIASGLGLRPDISGLEQPVASWAQLDETDLAFLRRLLARFDADLQIVGDALQVAARADRSRGAIDLTLNNQLARVRVTADLAHQATSVSVGGWNARDGSVVSGHASAPAHPGPGTGRDGTSWAGEVFPTRNVHLAGPAVDSDDEARAVATAALDRRARRFVVAEGTAEGNARLRVGAEVALSGISDQFDNTYTVVHACHRFDMAQGYRTEFRAECAFLAG